MEKYYYQKGMCVTSGYMSLNPVLYESTDSAQAYRKVKMTCGCVDNGTCVAETMCQLFHDAPDSIIDDGINLRNNKL